MGYIAVFRSCEGEEDGTFAFYTSLLTLRILPPQLTTIADPVARILASNYQRRVSENVECPE